MYFYYEHYHDACSAAEEDWRSGDRRDDSRACEPIQIPALVNWLVLMGVGLLVIVAAIDVLS